MSKRRISLATAAAALAISFSGAACAADVLFDFNNGLQGWSGTGGSIAHVANGGASLGSGDGYLQMSDVQGATDPMFAFSSALGAQSDKVGGQLSFDLYAGTNALPFAGNVFGKVSLYNGGAWVYFDPVPNGQAQTANAWANYSVPLLAGQWNAGSTGATLASVLGNLTEVRIVLESNPSNAANQLETLGLDNVSIAAVTKPHEWAMMVAGLGVVGAVVRRNSDGGAASSVA